MHGFRPEGQALVWEQNHETIRIEAWGPDGLRVRGAAGATIREARLPIRPEQRQRNVITKGADA